MARRYWISNGGNWNDTAHWSTSSGGSSGAAVPTSSDDVFFDSNSFSLASQTVTVNVNAVCLNMSWSGVTNTPTLHLAGFGTRIFDIYGSLTFVSGMALTSQSTSNDYTFQATTVGQTLTFGGQTIPNILLFRGNGGGWTLQDALTVASNCSVTVGRASLFPTVSLDINGQDVTFTNSTFQMYTGATVTLGSSKFVMIGGSLTKFDIDGGTLNMDSVTLVLANTTAVSGGMLDFALGTVNPGTSTIKLMGTGGTINDLIAGIRNLSGSALTLNTVILDGGSNYLIGDLVFTTLTMNPGSGLLLQPSQTITTTTLMAQGNSTDGIVIDTDGAGTATISATTAITEYITVSDNTATGTASPFNNIGGTDEGGTTGWTFTTPPHGNTALGSEAGYSNISGSGNVFLGYRAGYSELGSNKLYISNSSTATPLILGDFDADTLTFAAAVTATNFISTVATGTQPYATTSTTLNTNLNADMVDSVHVATLTDARLLRYESTGTQIENSTVTETAGALGGITTISMSGQLTNTLAIGTAPFAITSTTKVTNLNVDLLDDQSGAYYLDSANFTGTNWTDLTDAGDTTLHYHAADRVDANQTFTDVTTNDANTTSHGFALKAIAPLSGIRNIIAIDNTETIYKVTALLDSVAPADLAGTATAGTSLIAARRDHVHLGLTSVQLTDLTDGGATTLHSHAGGGYTNLTQFVDQTAWRVFYSDSLGDVTELALGSANTVLTSNGATSAPTWETPTSGSTDFLVVQVFS